MVMVKPKRPDWLGSEGGRFVLTKMLTLATACRTLSSLFSMSRVWCVLQLVVLVALLGQPVSASLCTNSTLASTCYLQRSQCHFNWSTSVCQVGAPSTCEAYYTDTVGCAAAPGCLINTWTNACFTPPSNCTTLGQTACGQRSDCRWSGSACLVGAAAGTCGTYTTASACGSASCYWDPYAPPSSSGACFFNLQEVQLLRGCSFWNGYPVSMVSGVAVNAACFDHGCYYDPVLAQCQTAGSGAGIVDVGAQSSTSVQFALANPTLGTNSLTFDVDIVVPMSQYWQPTHPMLHVFGIGTPPAQGQALMPAVGNSLWGAQPALGAGLPAASTYADQAGLLAAFITQVNTYNNISFQGLSAPVVSAIQGIIDQCRVEPGYNFLSGASVSGGNLVLHARFDLEQALAQVAGVTKVVGATATAYTVPFWLWARQTGNGLTDNVVVAAQWTYPTKDTTGSSIITGNSQNPYFVSRPWVYDNGTNCPPGQKQRFTQYQLTFTRVFDTTSIVGLRNLSDVSFRPPGYPLSNCFSENVTSVVPPTSCTSNQCITTLTTVTACGILTADGNGLNQCANQPAANRIRDMGADLPYPSNLDYQHNFFIWPKLWSAAAGVGDPGAVAVGTDPAGLVPDEVFNAITLATPPDLVFDTPFTIQGGFLPTAADTTFADAVQTFDTATGVNAVQLRNLQLRFREVLTPVIWLPTEAMRQTFVLTMTPTTITALNSAVRMLPGSITGAQIAPYEVYSPRSVVCSTCALLPMSAAHGWVGFDGTAVPVSDLRALLPGNGYSIGFNWRITIQPGAGPISGTGQLSPAMRRMLGLNDTSTEGPVVSSGQGALLVSFGNLTTTVLDGDLGPAAPSGRVALYVTLANVVAAVGAVQAVPLLYAKWSVHTRGYP